MAVNAVGGPTNFTFCSKKEKETRRERERRMFVIIEGNCVSSFVVAGLISFVVLPFSSEHDLQKEDVCLPLPKNILRD